MKGDSKITVSEEKYLSLFNFYFIINNFHYLGSIIRNHNRR